MTVIHEAAVAERTAQALEFLSQAEAEFAVGDTRQAAEKLYGAAVQAIIAASHQRGWDYQSHRANKNAALRLADEYDDPFLNAGFTAAEKLHIHFHHGDLENYQITADRQAVRQYVERMVKLVEEYEANGGCRQCSGSGAVDPQVSGTDARLEGRISTAIIRALAPLVVIAVVLLNSRQAGACSYPLSMSELAERADNIAVAFVGRQIDSIWHPEYGVTLVFEVDHVYKGEAGPLIQLRTGYGAGDCGVSFEGAGTVGITARWRGETGWGTEESDLVVTEWTATATVDELEAVFGAGYPPDDSIRLSEPSGDRATITALAVGGAAVALCAVLIALARRRKGAGRTDPPSWQSARQDRARADARETGGYLTRGS